MSIYLQGDSSNSFSNSIGTLKSNFKFYFGSPNKIVFPPAC